MIRVSLLVLSLVLPLVLLVCLSRRRTPAARTARGISAVLLVVALGSAVLLWFDRTRPATDGPAGTGNGAGNRAGGEDRASGAPRKTDAPSSSGLAFVTSRECVDCHAEKHASWHDSYHRTMTQQATPQAVVPSFAGVILKGRGREYALERRGDTFWANMVAPEWESQMVGRSEDPSSVPHPPRATREVLMTTGSHHMQTYWVRGLDGLRHFPWFFLFPEQQWIPREDSLLRPPDAPPLLPLWNVNCIKCHALGGVPGYDFRSSFDTQVAELGISCEACHGPAERHVEYHRAREAGEQARWQPAEARLVNPAACSPRVASEICGQCHSSSRLSDVRNWLQHGIRYRAGQAFDEHFQLIQFDDPAFREDPYVQHGYWPDGTCRTAGDELLGMAASACYQQGELSCLTCHSMHDYVDRSDQLKPVAETNDACLRCHQDYGDRLSEHTHHPPDSPGSLCYNCHMPHITYGLLKSIRSHRIDNPSVQTTLRTGRPNACNLCHLDQPLEWTARHLSQWYGAPPVRVPDEHRSTAASIVWLLGGNAVQRAVAAWHLGWAPAQDVSGSDWQAPLLAATLEDPYAAVRIVASRALKTLPGFADFSYRLVNTAAERQAARARAEDVWRSQVDGARPARPAVLIREDGRLDSDAIEQLRRRRDDTPVEIPE